MNTEIRDRRMVLLAPAAFLASLSIGVLSLAMIFVIKEMFGAGAQTVGWFSAFFSAAYFLGCVTLRKLSDRLGPRRSMALMNIGTAFLFVLFLLLPSMASAFAIYALYGFVTALFWPPLMSWVSSGLEGEALGKATNNFSLAWSSGGALSPYIAGVLLELGLLVPVYASIGLFFLTGLFIIGTRRIAPSPARTVPGKLAPGAEAPKDRSTPLRYPAWLGLFLIYTVLAVFFNIFPLFAKDDLHFTESKIGFLLLIRASFSALGFWILGRHGFWHFRKRFILLGVLALLILDLAFIPIRSGLAFALALAVLGLVHALCYNSSIFYGASGAVDRTRRMTVNEALLTLGQILGSVGGGILYQDLSWSSMFIFLSVLLVAGLGSQLWLLTRRI